MNPRARFIRIVLASAVGSLIWAGCATETVIINEPAGAEVGRMTVVPSATVRGREVPIYLSDIAAAPVDLTKRRPDTHPELRGGLWQLGIPDNPSSFPAVAETPVVEIPEAVGTADSTSLLAYNPVVVNVAASTPEPVEGAIITEAAGAERRPAPAAMEKPGRWWELWYRKRPPQTVPRSAVEVERVVPVEPAPLEVPPAEAPPGTYFQNYENTEDEPLLKLHMVYK